MTTPVDCQYKRIDGREVVEVQRVWEWPGQGLTVRAHPVRGGRPLVADADWFDEHYEPVAAAAPTPGGDQ